MDIWSDDASEAPSIAVLCELGEDGVRGEAAECPLQRAAPASRPSVVVVVVVVVAAASGAHKCNEQCHERRHGQQGKTRKDLLRTPRKNERADVHHVDHRADKVEKVVVVVVAVALPDDFFTTRRLDEQRETQGKQKALSVHVDRGGQAPTCKF